MECISKRDRKLLYLQGNTIFIEKNLLRFMNTGAILTTHCNHPHYETKTNLPDALLAHGSYQLPRQ